MKMFLLRAAAYTAKNAKPQQHTAIQKQRLLGCGIGGNDMKAVVFITAELFLVLLILGVWIACASPLLVAAKVIFSLNCFAAALLFLCSAIREARRR